MATTHKAFHITTARGAEGDALMRQLAAQTGPVDPDRSLVYGIELFAHLYDPQAFTAWLNYARDPLLGPSVQLDRDGRRSGGVRASQLPGPVAQGPGVGSITPSVPTPSSNLPPWAERIARAIDAMPPDLQVREAQHCIEAVLTAMVALNVSPQAIVPLREVYQRKLGWFRPSEENYFFLGIPGQWVMDRSMARLFERDAPGREGEWRQEASRLSLLHARSVRPSDARGYPARDVVFGFWKDYNAGDFGCRWQSGRSAEMPVGCYAPTGEVHTVWVEADARIRGGRMYAPSVLPREMQAEANVARDRLGLDPGYAGVRAHAPMNGDAKIVPVGPVGWSQGVLIGYERPRPYLHFYVPPRFYWDIFFAQHPEFGGLNFVDWLLARSPEENIRQMRRTNTARLTAVAEQVGISSINDLIGRAERNLQDEIRREETQRSAVEGVITSSAGNLARALGPAASLIAGAGTALYALFKSQEKESAALTSRRIDVYGHLTPAFTRFPIYALRAGFESALESRVGPTPAGPPPTPAMVALPVGGAMMPFVVPVMMPTVPQGSATLAVTPPAPPLDVQPPAPPGEGMSTGAKVAIVAGLGAAVAGGVWWSRRRR